MKHTRSILQLVFLLLTNLSMGGSGEFRVVGYYAGQTIPIDSFETASLTHLIYCFGKLDGNNFVLRNSMDTVIIRSMVELKKSHPDLRVMLSLGGWSGCPTCSDVFSSDEGRTTFARSVRKMSDYLHTDGIDIDWEYPVVKGFPGHKRSPEDREHFTELIRAIRTANNPEFEISFAAGGYTDYIDSAIDWKEVAPMVDFINIMSYDLVHGYSTVSGHHTPLYSTPQQKESVDHAVSMLLKHGVPSEKMVIGCGFYGRMFRIEPEHEVGLYQPCSFMYTFPFKLNDDSLSVENGFEKMFDETAKAPYAINKSRRILATYDDERSVALKTAYAKEHELGGIMFWQLYDDKLRKGLLDVIRRNK